MTPSPPASSGEPLVAAGVRVPHVVLQHEEQVEADGEDAEAQLGEVPRDGGPVVGVHRYDKHLGHAQNPSCAGGGALISPHGYKKSLKVRHTVVFVDT